MWPFNSKEKEAKKMWDMLTDAPDPKAMNKMIDAIQAGDIETTEKLYGKIMRDKIKEITNNNQKPFQ